MTTSLSTSLPSTAYDRTPASNHEPILSIPLATISPSSALSMLKSSKSGWANLFQKVSSICLATWGPQKPVKEIQISRSIYRGRDLKNCWIGFRGLGGRCQNPEDPGLQENIEQSNCKMEVVTFQQSCVEKEKFAPVLKITRVENPKFQIRLSMDLLCQDGFLYHDCISPLPAIPALEMCSDTLHFIQTRRFTEQMVQFWQEGKCTWGHFSLHFVFYLSPLWILWIVSCLTTNESLIMKRF